MKKQQPNENGLLYKMTLVAAVLQPLMTLPQAIQIYSTQDASGVSLFTWLGFLVFGAIFLAYGIRYHLKPIAIAQSIWFVLQLAVVIGILLWS